MVKRESRNFIIEVPQKYYTYLKKESQFFKTSVDDILITRIKEYYKELKNNKVNMLLHLIIGKLRNKWIGVKRFISLNIMNNPIYINDIYDFDLYTAEYMIFLLTKFRELKPFNTTYHNGELDKICKDIIDGFKAYIKFKNELNRPIKLYNKFKKGIELLSKELTNLYTLESSNSKIGFNKYGIKYKDVINTYTTIKIYLLYSLNEFKKITISYPNNLTFKQWKKTIHKIIDEILLTGSKKYKGLNLLIKYYEQLWI